MDSSSKLHTAFTVVLLSSKSSKLYRSLTGFVFQTQLLLLPRINMYCSSWVPLESSSRNVPSCQLLLRYFYDNCICNMLFYTHCVKWNASSRKMCYPTTFPWFGLWAGLYAQQAVCISRFEEASICFFYHFLFFLPFLLGLCSFSWLFSVFSPY